MVRGRVWENCTSSGSKNARVELARLVTLMYSNSKQKWVWMQDNHRSAGDYFHADYK